MQTILCSPKFRSHPKKGNHSFTGTKSETTNSLSLLGLGALLMLAAVMLHDLFGPATAQDRHLAAMTQSCGWQARIVDLAHGELQAVR